MLLALLEIVTIVVAPGTAVPTIADAVRDAPPGARIVVQPGTYRETAIRVDRSVEIVGEGRPVVDAGGSGSAFVVTAEDVTIRGLAIRNTGRTAVEDRAGVRLDGAHRCVVVDNEIADSYFGVYVARTRGCRIERNTITGTGIGESATGNAIHLWNSDDVLVVANHTSRHRDGIYLEFARRARITGNTSVGNLRYGLHFMFSDDAEYRHNVFGRNGAGVAVMYTKHVVMEGNRFEDNRGQAAYGLLLKDISDSRIAGNDIRDNTVGLHVEGSNRIEIVGNRIERNGWAVKLMANSTDNLFTGNTFSANTFDVATNGRAHSSRFDGNRWDHYQGYDLDRDGIGDVPFRPVRLFAYLVARHDMLLVLQRSLFVDLLDAAERVLPVLAPEALVDPRPLVGAGR